jgi:hypothetical protein
VVPGTLFVEIFLGSASLSILKVILIMQDFNFSYNYAIIIATYVSAFLGVIGSIFTITTFLLFKNTRNTGTSLIFCLAIGDFFLSFGLSVFWILFDQEDHVACNIQGVVVMFGICASLMWSLMIGTYNLFKVYSLCYNLFF